MTTVNQHLQDHTLIVISMPGYHIDGLGPGASALKVKLPVNALSLQVSNLRPGSNTRSL